MKFIGGIIILVFLSACGKGGGAGEASSAPKAPVDSTPHDYAVGFTVLGDYAQDHLANFHQVCNFGLAGLRDESTVHAVLAPATGGEHEYVGCGPAQNYTFEIKNTGSVNLDFNMSIDGVYHPELDRVVVPGETYTFQRGF